MVEPEACIFIKGIDVLKPDKFIFRSSRVLWIQEFLAFRIKDLAMNHSNMCAKQGYSVL